MGCLTTGCGCLDPSVLSPCTILRSFGPSVLRSFSSGLRGPTRWDSRTPGKANAIYSLCANSPASLPLKGKSMGLSLFHRPVSGANIYGDSNCTCRCLTTSWLQRRKAWNVLASVPPLSWASVPPLSRAVGLHLSWASVPPLSRAVGLHLSWASVPPQRKAPRGIQSSTPSTTSSARSSSSSRMAIATRSTLKHAARSSPRSSLSTRHFGCPLKSPNARDQAAAARAHAAAARAAARDHAAAA